MLVKPFRNYLNFRRGDSRIAHRFVFNIKRRAIRELTLRKNLRCNGFTLIEIIVTLIVMAIAFTSLTVWMVNANKHSVDPLLSMRATELGQSYLEEILAKRFDENTVSGGILRCDESGQPACSTTLTFEGGETRATYDDVDDYNGIDDDGAVDPLGNARAEYTDYRVRVNVTYAGTDLALNLNDAKRIDVTVQHSSSGIFVFSAYRGNF
jgi:MSHA pilin protein MshD